MFSGFEYEANQREPTPHGPRDTKRRIQLSARESPDLGHDRQGCCTVRKKRQLSRDDLESAPKRIFPLVS